MYLRRYEPLRVRALEAIALLGVRDGWLPDFFFFFFRLLFVSRSVSPTRLNFLHWALLSSVNSTCLELPFHR